MSDVTAPTTRRHADVEVSTIVTGQRWKQNCYLLQHLRSGEAVLIDPGDNADEIWRVVMARGGRLRHILLTHGHYDHVGAAPSIARSSGLSCSMHRADTRTLRHAPAYGLRFEGKRVEPVDTVNLFDDGQTFGLGGQAVTALHMPGHTPGSAVYVLDGFAFTGDTLFHRRVGRTDLPGGDAAVLAASIERLLLLLEDHTVVLPGHGYASTVGDARTWWASHGNDAPAQAAAATHDRQTNPDRNTTAEVAR